MINKFKSLITSVVKKTDDILVNMDGGVGGSWKVECSIDDKQVDCSDFQENCDEGESFKQDVINYYTGVPAPAYLNDDDWFGPAPIRSQKQLDYMERETEMKRQERNENFSVEPDNIHEMMYNMATQNQLTTIQLNPPGGSENFHEGPGGWTSGTGMGQFQ